MYSRGMKTSTRIGVGLMGIGLAASLTACGPEQPASANSGDAAAVAEGGAPVFEGDPVIDQARNPAPEAQEPGLPYNEAAGATNLALGRITCVHMQAEYDRGERYIRVTAVMDPMPADPILAITVQSSRKDYDIIRHGDDVAVEGDTVSTVIDASPVGYAPRAFATIKYSTANGNHGGAECDADGV